MNLKEAFRYQNKLQSLLENKPVTRWPTPICAIR